MDQSDGAIAVVASLLGSGRIISRGDYRRAAEK
jgi:hypothetical protein